MGTNENANANATTTYDVKYVANVLGVNAKTLRRFLRDVYAFDDERVYDDVKYTRYDFDEKRVNDIVRAFNAYRDERIARKNANESNDDARRIAKRERARARRARRRERANASNE